MSADSTLSQSLNYLGINIKDDGKVDAPKGCLKLRIKEKCSRVFLLPPPPVEVIAIAISVVTEYIFRESGDSAYNSQLQEADWLLKVHNVKKTGSFENFVK